MHWLVLRQKNYNYQGNFQRKVWESFANIVVVPWKEGGRLYWVLDMRVVSEWPEQNAWASEQ